MAQARWPRQRRVQGTLRTRGSAGKRGGQGPARRAQCSYPEAGRRLRALSPGCIVAWSLRGGSEAAGCAAEHSLLAEPLAGRGDGGAHLTGGAPRRLGPAGKPAPLCRVHAGRAAAPWPTLLRAPRPSLSPPGPRPVPAARTSFLAPSSAPQPCPERDLFPSRPAVIAWLGASQTIPYRPASLPGTSEGTPTLALAKVSILKAAGVNSFPVAFRFPFLQDPAQTSDVRRVFCLFPSPAALISGEVFGVFPPVCKKVGRFLNLRILHSHYRVSDWHLGGCQRVDLTKYFKGILNSFGGCGGPNPHSRG